LSGYEKRQVRLPPIKHVLNGCFGRFEALFRFFRVLLRRMVGALSVEREVRATLKEAILLR
jgi:hypothetical protein